MIGEQIMLDKIQEAALEFRLIAGLMAKLRR